MFASLTDGEEVGSVFTSLTEGELVLVGSVLASLTLPEGEVVE